MKKRDLLQSDQYREVVDLYIRVSSAEQAREGYSVGEQEHRLREFCRAMNWKIHQVAVDAGYSGATLNRPGINEIISDAKAQCIHRVVVWKLDRLSRSQKDTLFVLEDVLLRNDVYFTSMMEAFDTSTPFGRAIVGILAAFAQLERENIKERTTMGRVARISQGHYSGSHAPFGYSFKAQSNDLEVNDFEAIIVQEIYRDFLSGTSIKGIANSIKSRFGNAARNWDGTIIRRILSNPVYIGKVRNNDNLYDGIHDPIISAEDFSLANSILEHNRQIKKQCIRSKALLTGILYCGDCGARMQPRRITGRYDLRRYVCYSVSRTSKPMIRSDHCTNRLHPFRQEELDEIIINEIKKLAIDPEYLKLAFVSDRAEKDDGSAAISKRLSEISSQYNKLIDLYQAGIIEFSDISDRLSTLKTEREALQAALVQTDQAPNMTMENVRAIALSFSEVLDEGDDDQIKAIIRSLIDRIVVLNDQVEIYWTFS